MTDLSDKVNELSATHNAVVYVDDSFMGVRDNFGLRRSLLPLLPKTGCLWLAQMLNHARFHQAPVVCLEFHTWPQEEILFIQETLRGQQARIKVIGFSSAETFVVRDHSTEHANEVLEQWTQLCAYAKLLGAPIVSSLHDAIIQPSGS